MTSLRTRLTRLFFGFMVLALVASAVGTATVLHLQALASLDRTLLAAAFGEAHPWQEQRYHNDSVRSSVTVQPWNDEKPVVPRAFYEQAVSGRDPVWLEQDGHRVLVLAVEYHDPQTNEQSLLVVVSMAPVVQLRATVGPFLLAYGGAAGLALALALGLLSMALAKALGPLERATTAIGAVAALDPDSRLTLDGPPEVRMLLSATNGLLDRLDKAYRSQMAFTALAAHELRTPVAILKGEVDLALRRERTGLAYREVLERLQPDFGRLHALVEGLLVFSRVDAGHVERGRTLERLSHPVQLAMSQERRALASAGCRVVLSLEADPELLIHVPLLTTAVATLLRNVARHAPGSTLTVSSASQGNTVALCLDDDGPGIADPDTMFERFARSTNDGLGLGLPMARDIVRRHGGDLTVQPGPGARLLLTLPLAHSEQVPASNRLRTSAADSDTVQ